MKIIEVRESFIKFESAENLTVSSFIKITDIKACYISQVIKVTRYGEKFIGLAKILFNYNGNLLDYDNGLPSIDAELSVLDFNTIKNSFVSKNPIIIGNSFNENISIDKECFDKKLLICIDNSDKLNTLISNLAKQFDKSLVIDTVGNITQKKYIAGVDFKLPLNSDSLEFIYEDCLNDATSDSKGLIKEIFQDLAGYAKTVTFLPFTTLKTIVDDMVDKSHIFKLLVLKNKLAKFDKMGYFAQTNSESENLEQLLKQKNIVIDISKLDTVFQNRYLSVIYSALEKQNIPTQIFLKASNNLNKKNLKRVLTGKFSTTFVTHSGFKYIHEIKTFFENYVIEPSFNTNLEFKEYSSFLNTMDSETYLVSGKCTKNIPLICQSSILSISTNQEVNQTSESASIEQEEIDLTDEELLKELRPSDDTTDSDSASEIVIEKKSEAVISKIAEEILPPTQSELNIFEDEESEADKYEKMEISEGTTETLDDTDLIQDESVNPEDSEEEEEVSEIQDDYKTSLSDDNYEELSIETDLKNSENEESLNSDISMEDNQALDTTQLQSVEDFNTEDNAESYHTQVDEIQVLEVPEDISDYAESTEEETEDTIEENLIENIESDDKNLTDEPDTEIVDVNSMSEDIEAIEDSDITNDNLDLGEIIELDESESTEGDIIIDLEEDSQLATSDEVDREIVEDVDKVFTTIKESTISDSDLDFIDELNENADESEEVILPDGMEELTELQQDEAEDDGFLEQLEEVNDDQSNEGKEILETKNSTTPIVPVYEAEIPPEDTVMSDPIEQGDTVVHAKYGNGVVEKMIKYGSKTLYSINFDNIGRRLLDPTLTEIKKY